MELTCAVFVALIGLVAATPSGYGVKGGAAAGAVAKAEANSGAFAGSGIPGSIPFPTVPGATVSGSYAKSSSSNFAASSSSASSSSFSFSGSGVIPGTANCQSGKCTGNDGAGNTGNVIAGATANAGSAGYGNINTPCSNSNCHKPTCQASNCDDSEKKCTSGDCSGTGTTSDSNDIAVNTAGSTKSSYGMKSPIPNSGCSNGKCDSKNPDYEEGHISSSAFQTPNKPSTTFSTPKVEPPCSSPNCGSAKDDIYDKNKPSSYNVPILATSETSVFTNDCASGKCQNNPTKNTDTTKVSSHPGTAFTPFVSSEPNCLGPNCPGSPSSPVGGAPSSFPKYPGQPQPSQPFYPTTFGSANAGANAAAVTLPFVPLQQTTKKLLPYTGGFGGPPGILKPEDFTVSTKTSNYKPPGPHTNYSPPNPTVSCSSGTCNAQPNSGSPQQGSIHISGGQYNPQAQQGCVSGNCELNPSQSPAQYKPSGLPSENQHKPPAFNNPCVNGNCQNKPTKSYPNDGTYPDDESYPNDGSYPYPDIQKPDAPTGPYTQSSCSSGNCGQKPSFTSAQKLPAYQPTKPTTVFGGPSGFLKPNENKPSSGHSTNYNPISPNYRPSVPCSSGNCGSQTYPNNPVHPSTFPGIGAHSGVLKPNDHISQPNAPTSAYKPTGQAAPCSTGTCASSYQYNPSLGYNPSPTPGFGGPAGILKPIDHNLPSNAPVSSYKPPGPANPTPSACSFGNCGPKPDSPPSTPLYNPAPSYNPSTPAPGFGGPAGVLKPIDHNLSSNAPVSSYKPSEPANPIPSACSFGNCGLKPDSTPLYNPAPSYNTSAPAPGFGGPAGVLKPIDHNLPSNAPVSSYKPPGPANPTPSACSFGNCGPKPDSPPSTPLYNPAPSYNPSAPAPGFGGPGVLKPIDHNLPSNAPVSSYKPSAPANPIPSACSFGNCGSKPDSPPPSLPLYNPAPSENPSTPAPGFGGPAGVLKPIDNNFPSNSPVSSYKPPGPENPTSSACSFGNCGPIPDSTPMYNPAPSYNPSAPAPGFGGPAGVLKPFDHNTPSNGPASHFKPTGPTINPTPCSFGSCGPQPNPSSPQYNPAPSYKPTAPFPGFGAPSGFLKPNDYNSQPNVPTSSYKPLSQTSCTSGKCGSPSQINQSPGYSPSALAPGFSGPVSSYKPAGSAVNPTTSVCSFGNCGPQTVPSPQYNPAPAYKPTGQQPGHSSSQYNPAPVYSPSVPVFGGPTGAQNPNYNSPFNAPVKNPAVSYNPHKTPCLTGNCVPQHSQTGHYQPEYKPTATYHGFDYSAPSNLKPSDSAGPYSLAPCTSGSCGNGPIGAVSSAGASNSYSPGCTSGNCGAQQPSQNSQSGAGTYSVASAKAVAYTAGFGGPPGLLKPFDGKDGNAGEQGLYGKSLNGNKNAAGSGAQAGVAAGAAAGSYSGNHSGKKPEGCSGGCGGQGGSAAVASAKSIASAGAGAYGNGGSFASSSASAHASATAGASTKGGYGR